MSESKGIPVDLVPPCCCRGVAVGPTVNNVRCTCPKLIAVSGNTFPLPDPNQQHEEEEKG